MRTRLLAVLCCLAATLLPAPADAALVGGCTFDGTVTFSPPLTLQPASGTWAATGLVTCVQATVVAGNVTWGPVGFVTTPSGRYTGSCLQATWTDGYGLSVSAAGSAVTTVWTSPFYGVHTGVLVSLSGSCPAGLSSVRMVTTGPGVTP